MHVVCRVLLFVLLGGVLSPQVTAQSASLPAAQLKKIKAATVFVKVKIKEAQGSGSGFFVKSVADGGLVVTNDHVIDPPVLRELGIVGERTIELVFNSGEKNEWSARADIVGRDPERDLALLKVKPLRPFPEPLSLTSTAELQETMPVYVCGFPFGEALSASDKNPEISIGLASVSSIRKDDRGELAAVQLNGALNPGNSGGPVVAADGKLVGVAVKTVRAAGLGIAIPAPFVQEMLSGRVSDPVLRQERRYVVQRLATVDVWTSEMGDRVRSVRVHILPQTAEQTPKDISNLGGTIKVDLIPNGTMRGAYSFGVMLPPSEEVWLQTVWVDKEGQSHKGIVVKAHVMTVKDYQMIDQLTKMLEGDKSPQPKAPTPPPSPRTNPNPIPNLPPVGPNRPLGLNPFAQPSPPPSAPPSDGGVRGLRNPNNQPLPPLATRLPATPAGQMSMKELDQRCTEFLNQEVMVDLILTIRNYETPSSGPLSFSRIRNGSPMNIRSYLTHRSLTETMKRYAGHELAVRVRGRVLNSPTGSGHALSIDQIGLLTVDGTVCWNINREGYTPAAEKPSVSPTPTPTPTPTPPAPASTPDVKASSPAPLVTPPVAPATPVVAPARAAPVVPARELAASADGPGTLGIVIFALVAAMVVLPLLGYVGYRLFGSTPAKPTARRGSSRRS